MSSLAVGFVALLIIPFGLRLWLGVRNITFLRADGDRPATRYSVAREKVAVADAGLAAALWFFFGLGGGYDYLEAGLAAIGLATFAVGLVALVTMIGLCWVARNLTGLYATLVVDARHGLGRASITGVLLDLAKRGCIGLILTVAAAAIATWLLNSGSAYWWVTAWLLWTGGSAVQALVYPVFIAPLFQRLSPLEDDILSNRLTTLAARAGIGLPRVLVSDTSKRSSRANASFDGLGPAKRITVSDTLLDALDVEEVEAVVAHEIGHYRRHHILIHFWAVAALRFLSLACLALLADRQGLPQTLGLESTSPEATLAVIWLLFVAARPLARPLEATLLRYFEFDADAYAGRHSLPRALASALGKLFQVNASAPRVDPLHATLLQGHPPLSARLERLARWY
jgi:STE24 endopeptidase